MMNLRSLSIALSVTGFAAKRSILLSMPYLKQQSNREEIKNRLAEKFSPLRNAFS